jgi:hypothetical protein
MPRITTPQTQATLIVAVLTASAGIAVPAIALAQSASFKVANIQNKQKYYLSPLAIDDNKVVIGVVMTQDETQVLGQFQSEKGSYSEITSCDSTPGDVIYPTAADSADDTAGFCGNNNYLRLGSNGAVTLFQANPNAARITGVTPATNIMTGFYYEYNGTTNQAHGILGTIGHFTTIDPPGSVDTFPTAISPDGKVTGFFDNASGQAVGFTLINGVYDIFSPAGWATTYPAGINNAGQVAGTYTLSGGGPSAGFAYQAGNPPITFFPNGVTEVVIGGINAAGNIAGSYLTDANIWGGLMWAPWGYGPFEFEAPAGASAFFETAINDSSDMAGVYENPKSKGVLFEAICHGRAC